MAATKLGHLKEQPQVAATKLGPCGGIAEAGTHCSAAESVEKWVPACAGIYNVAFRRIDLPPRHPYVPRLPRFRVMKIANSLKTLKKRDKNCRIVRRKGRVYVINKTNPRFKARQG